VIPPYFSVKEAVFPFNKFPGVDPILGPEMRSTGEVMGVGPSFGEAFAKAQRAAGAMPASAGRAILCVRSADLGHAGAVGAALVDLGFELSAWGATATSLRAAGVPANDLPEARGPAAALQSIARRDIALLVLTADGSPESSDAFRALRIAALAAGTPLITTLPAAKALVRALDHAADTTVRRLQELHPVMAAAAITRASAGDAERLNVFVRQPYTEAGAEEQRVVADVLGLLDEFNGAPQPFNYLVGARAENADTFKRSFETETGIAFTPDNFRGYRMQRLDSTDLFVNIRVGLSESSAFELGYHIFRGRCTPVLYLVWKRAPIKTTLLRDLESLCDVTYLEFERVEELRPALREFFAGKLLPPSPLRARTDPCEVSRLHS